MATITASVGQNGLNRHQDVVTIQKLLNARIGLLTPLAPLVVDGKVGSKTITAITEFQRRVVKLSRPDGRVDANGRTLKTLNAPPASGTPQPPPAPPVGGAPGNGTVSSSVVYSDRLSAGEKIVHSYCFSVLEMVMRNAGCTKAVITSTIRTPAAQVDIMYRNAKIDLQKQYALYGPTGDKVLKVYEENRTKPETTVKALMIAKIEELAKLGQRVSLHVTTPAIYATRNIIDIGVNSTKAVAGNSFNEAKITAAFAKAAQDGYIAKFIDETKKSNTCWHAEIIPNVKPLPAT